MSKFIKCWVFIICLLFIFLIIFTDRVNAETLTSIYINNNNLANNTSNVTCNNGTCSLYFSFSSDITFSGTYQGVKGNILPIATLDTQYYDLSGLSWSNICSSTQWISSSQGGQYTITYADGTHATISGSEYDAYCSRYNSSYTSQSSISTIVIDNKPYIQLKVLQTHPNNYSTFSPCDVDSNGRFYCPIDSSIKNLHGFQIILGNSGYTNVFQVTLTRELQLITSDTQQIINNNNTNTQTIHNDNQQQYNFISNSTIDSTTTDDVNTIDVSNSDTKLAVTNFALIPLNFMQSIINSFSSSCSQVCIGNCGSGHDNDWRFIFPCLDFENILGSTLYSVIDSLFAFGMVFAFIRSVRKFFINALLLTTDASSEVGVFL